MNEKGFFDELVEDISKDIELYGAIEASRDSSGYVDPIKASGIAMGLGHTSFEDTARLGAFLGASGAFDGGYTSSNDGYNSNFDSGSDTDYSADKPTSSDTSKPRRMNFYQAIADYQDSHKGSGNFVINKELTSKAKPVIKKIKRSFIIRLCVMITAIAVMLGLSIFYGVIIDWDSVYAWGSFLWTAILSIPICLWFRDSVIELEDGPEKLRIKMKFMGGSSTRMSDDGTVYTDTESVTLLPSTIKAHSKGKSAKKLTANIRNELKALDLVIKWDTGTGLSEKNDENFDMFFIGMFCVFVVVCYSDSQVMAQALDTAMEACGIENETYNGRIFSNNDNKTNLMLHEVFNKTLKRAIRNGYKLIPNYSPGSLIVWLIALLMKVGKLTAKVVDEAPIVSTNSIASLIVASAANSEVPFELTI